MSIQTVRVVLVGTFPQASTRDIDLGLIDAVEVTEAGFVELLPFVEGRIIQEVFFTMDGFVSTGGNLAIYFTTLNTFIAAIGTDGLASWSAAAIPIPGNPTNYKFKECGPLYAVAAHPTWNLGPYTEWIALTKVTSQYETIVRTDPFYGGQRVWYVSIGGITGATEPDWNIDNSPITDGSAVWNAFQDLPTVGKVHAYARVSESSGVITPRIGSLEFIQQPTNTVAGQIITPAPSVRVLDQDGNPFTGVPFDVQVECFVVGDAGGGRDAIINPSTAIATYNSHTIIPETPATGTRLRAWAGWGIDVPVVYSNTFNVT